MKRVLVVSSLLFLVLWTGSLEARSITDLAGRVVEVPDVVERIVALRGALSLICYLNLADRVVGVEYEETTETRWIGSKGRTYRMANPHLGRLPVVGTRGMPEPERILRVQPQVIFLGSSARRMADRLQRQTGIPVVVVDVGDLGAGKDRFFRSLRLIGKICGREGRVKEVVGKIEDLVRDLERRTVDIPASERKKVYIGGLQFRVAHGLLGTSKNYPPFQMVNAMNVVDNLKVGGHLVKGRFSLDPETLLRLDPPVIFICESGLPLAMKDLEGPVFCHLSAVRKGAVYGLLPHYYAADPATVLAEAYYVGKVLYPSRFRDVEIGQLADELYRFFLGRPLYAKMAELFGGFRPLVLRGCGK